MKQQNDLEGLLVVSLEQAVAAPYCCLLLADAGARVIKVERPEGDFARGYDAGANGASVIFAWLNRGKESICLDLKKEGDMALMRNVLKQADVFVSNLAPGAVNRLGLSGQSLRKGNPGLITCQITGYGDSGQAAQKKAYDFLLQGESGLCSVTGTEENPARVGVSLADLSSGLTAYAAILRALIKRSVTSVGSDINISMFDVIADWMNMPLLAHRYMGGAPPRSGLQHSFISPYGAFTCKHGAQVLLSIQSNREWAVFCEKVLKQPDLVKDPAFRDNPDRYSNRVELDAIVNAEFEKHEAREVIAMLDDAKIANAALNSVADLSDHTFLRNAVATCNGMEVEMAALPWSETGSDAVSVPSLDEHGGAVRAEFERESRP